ncbi:hypothetical protein R3P38DRAFT_3239712 [Favolaschia claudopus]|uniref:Uncharacterized protein n=1 Tax=Favolaschia claudopus TaxID=2862362 RepID=A0AAV9Z783_9AGAR
MHKAHPAAAKSTPKPTAASESVDEVGDLIKRMSRISIEDPEYSYLYWQSIKKDSQAADCLRKPNLNIAQPPLSPNNFRNNQFVPPGGQNPRLNTRPEDRHCYGCGENGDCTKIQEVVARGDLKRGERGTVEWPVVVCFVASEIKTRL